jgi:hypothetical protein
VTREKTPSPVESEDEDSFETPPQSPSIRTALRQEKKRRSSDFPPHGRLPKVSRAFSSNDEGPASFSSTELARRPASSLAKSFVSDTSSAAHSFHFSPHSAKEATSFDTDITAPDVSAPKATEEWSSSSNEYSSGSINRAAPSTAEDWYSAATRTLSSSRRSSVEGPFSHSVDSDLVYEATRREETGSRTPNSRPPPHLPGAFMLDSAFPARMKADNDTMPEHHKIRDISKHGLLSTDFPTTQIFSKSTPFFVRYECVRIALETGVAIAKLAENLPASFDYDEFWTSIIAILPSNAAPKQPSRAVWQWCLKSNGRLALPANLAYKESGHRLLNLSLEPIRAERPCRFQRKFGSDRFIYLLIPSTFALPQAFRCQESHFRRRLVDAMSTETEFLDRTWRAIHIEPRKQKKKMRSKDKRDSGYRLILFATSGVDIPSVSLLELFTWFFPLTSDNLNRPYCKVFSRLDLGKNTYNWTSMFMADFK